MSQDYSQFDGKKVVVTLTNESTLEGTVDSGNEMGLLFKPKGKASLDLIEASQIVKVESAPDVPKKLAVKALLPLRDTQSRQHLVDRHGYKIADIEGLSDEDSLTFHEGDVPHEGLAHSHDGKPKAAKDAEGDAEAEADAA